MYYLDSCIARHSALPNDGKLMTCAECKLSYHLGQICSGIASNTFTTMGQAKRHAWVCKTCRASKKRTSLQLQADQTLASEATAANNPLLLEIMNRVESLPQLHGKLDSLLSMKAEVVKLTKTVQDLEKAVTEMTKDYRDVTKELEESQKTVKANEAELSALKATMQAQALELQQILEEENAAEQYSRNANLEIHGLPTHTDKNLHDIVNDLAEKLELPNLSPDGVTAVHRIPSKRGDTPTVSIRFKLVSTKERCSEARKKLRALHDSGKIP
ncbi:hypothetical protein HPB48_006911 [Haemaphysalis longicornis]|uniref:Uncharacterized protein n=1 Tax=Haemaphysalis longicornis TaxID=44386 RepID=A0A9J6FEI2_HAELO|nr:hypothetical protein HPB48_006911 [Haemaphysalis longicornis]